MAQRHNPENRPPRSRSHAPEMTPDEIRKAAVRLDNLQRLNQAADGNLPALAAAANMGPQRLRDALEGTLAISRELAMHVEYSLKLSPNWLDNPKSSQTPIPPETTARLKAALAGESLDEEDDEARSVEASAPAGASQAPAEPVTPTQPQEQKGLFESARAKSKAPNVEFKRRRRTAEAAVAAAKPPVQVAPAAPVPAAAPGRKRGRRPGQISISPELQEFRLKQLRELTREPGSKSRLCRLLGSPDSFISHLTAGRRTITDAVAERIAEVLQLSKDYFELPGAGKAAEPSASAEAAAKPAKAKRRPSVQDAPIQQGRTHMLSATGETRTAEVLPIAKPAPAQPVRAAAPEPTPAAVAVAERPATTAAAQAAPAPFALSVGEGPLDGNLKMALTALLQSAIAQKKLTNTVALELMSTLVKSLEG